MHVNAFSRAVAKHIAKTISYLPVFIFYLPSGTSNFTTHSHSHIRTTLTSMCASLWLSEHRCNLNPSTKNAISVKTSCKSCNYFFLFYFFPFSWFNSIQLLSEHAHHRVLANKFLDEREPKKETEKSELVSLVFFGAKLATDLTMETRDCHANTNEIEYERKKWAWMIVMWLRLVSR